MKGELIIDDRVSPFCVSVLPWFGASHFCLVTQPFQAPCSLVSSPVPVCQQETVHWEDHLQKFGRYLVLTQYHIERPRMILFWCEPVFPLSVGWWSWTAIFGNSYIYKSMDTKWRIFNINHYLQFIADSSLTISTDWLLIIISDHSSLPSSTILNHQSFWTIINHYQPLLPINQPLLNTINHYSQPLGWLTIDNLLITPMDPSPSVPKSCSTTWQGSCDVSTRRCRRRLPRNSPTSPT